MALTDLVALASLADLKADLGITDSSTDAALERRILSASALIESYCNRQFRRSVDLVERVAGYGTARLLLARTPIESVASVTYDEALVPASAYEIEPDSRGEGWALYASAGWSWTAPAVQTIDEMPVALAGMERRTFEVMYTGGYYLPNDTVKSGVALPAVLTEACLMLAATMWSERGRGANVMAESVGDASVQFGYLGGVDAAPASNGGIPGTIAAMLDGYKRAV